ncbi:MAG: dihydrofolate reductase [Mycoplasmataceae bacterium]|nr:dihydrofolate reductase [Mycoplasmataceae bacterium]
MIKLVWAEDLHGGIGLGNKLPWKIKEEMEHFVKTTINQVVVMGSNTYASIGKPLPNRENIVLSFNENKKIDGVKVYNSVDQILRDYQDKDVYVIGGKKTFEAFWDIADELIVSVIQEIYDCDLFMDRINLNRFVLVKEENHDLFVVKYYLRKYGTK